jgi:hypothetical protein
MKPVHLTAVVSLLAVLAAGCSAPKPEAESITKGIRLRDLQSPDAAERGMMLPPAVNLEASTFVVPAGQYERAIRVIMPLLVTGPGILKNPDDFRANGFVAATGTMQVMGQISAVLSQSGVRSVSNNYYSVFDEKGNDIEMATMGGAVSLPYVRSGQQSTVLVRPGVLALRVTVRRSGRGSACKLIIQPAWKASSDSSFVERASGLSRDVIFANSGVEVTAQEGDIVLVAPATASRTQRLGETMMVTPNGGEVRLTIVKCTGITQ